MDVIRNDIKDYIGHFDFTVFVKLYPGNLRLFKTFSHFKATISRGVRSSGTKKNVVPTTICILFPTASDFWRCS